jgi:hypothetical protein
MDKTRVKINELQKKLEIANILAKYKQRYYECRPECLHLLLNECSPLLENYIDKLDEYDIEKVKKELHQEFFNYFTEIKLFLFNPVSY